MRQPGSAACDVNREGMFSRIRDRVRNHVWGPVDKVIAIVLALALVGGVTYAVISLLPEDCEGVLQKGGDGECGRSHRQRVLLRAGP